MMAPGGPGDAGPHARVTRRTGYGGAVAVSTVQPSHARATGVGAVRSPAPARRRLRGEIQALRAVAVASVVLYHVWPGAVPGGFAGVDVFFAISGFLITGMLLAETRREGRVRLAAFWARRARRLLPAALLTVVACLVATLLVVPVLRWPQFLDDMRAGTLYAENWHLAARAVDYFAAGDGPSPVQHFWTLSAEEQFYLAWPLLLLLAVLPLRLRRGPRPGRTGVAHGRVLVVLGTVTTASFAWSLHEAAADPRIAYFSTFARAWEFGLGGVLAVLVAMRGRPRLRRRGRVLLTWLGLGAIVGAVVAFDDGTPFPGVAALLPVGGALAVIAAGGPEDGRVAVPLLGSRPVQWLGDVSYAAYLWHWPLLVLGPFALGHALGPVGSAGVVALTLVAAWASTRLVEEPVRAAPALTRRGPAWTLVLAATATSVVVAATAAGDAIVGGRLDRERARTAAVLAHPPRCFGAAARDPRLRCDASHLARTVVPTPLEAAREGNSPCAMVLRRARLRVCAFGAPAATARATVALLGDSHAAAWRAALSPVARREGWRGLSVTRSGCPFVAAELAVPEPERTHCRVWNAQVRGWFRAHPEVRTVFVAARAGLRIAGVPARRMDRAVRAAYASAWRTLPPTVARIVVLRDTPLMRGATADCVQRAVDAHAAAARTCAVPRARALRPDPAVAAARGLPDRVHVADLTDVFCDRRACLPVIGGALAYRDEDHLTATFARTLAPQLRRQVGGAAG